jgi:long-chain fatty acid transport protein
MKKIILLSALTSSMLLATNGDLMLGDGAKSSGMGGVGIAISHGAESLYANPAMIKDVKGSEFSGYVTMFQPDVNFASDAGSDTGGGVAAPSATPVPASSKSDADRSFIPGFAYVHRNNDHVVWGISLAGTAGMGTDYKNASPQSGAFGMQTELGIAKLSVPVAYTTGGLTVAVAPVLQYSTLKINYNSGQASDNKKDSSVGLGVTGGLAYDIGDLTLGGIYKSKIEATYKNNISSALRDFGMRSVTSGDRLDQPEEYGVGAAYTIGGSTLAVDARRVNWSKAKGYGDFGWEDQNILAVGYQYKASSWAIRAGYNHGKSPIVAKDGSAAANGANFDNAATNYFNLSGFPAIVEEHMTVGADYSISDNLDLSLAFVYSPEVKESFDTTAMSAGMAYNGALQNGLTQAQAGAMAQASSTGSTANVTHSQKALTLGMTYKF